MLYDIIVKPIEYLIEVIFVIMLRFFGHPGYAIIAVSMAVSFLTLPLYLRADAIQEEERVRQEKMKPWMTHIRRTFKKDEQYMMLNAYYSENGYKPLHAFKGTISLLLQVPFFIAAYHFLSTLEMLHGCSFGPVLDMGAEDALLKMGPIQINILPVMMTVINMGSSVVYTKGLSLKEKMQPFLLAVLFLIVLYHSPSGLVLYWTLNNLFSLMKNIVVKYVKNKAGFLSIIALVTGIAYLVYLFAGGIISRAYAAGDREAVLFYLLLFSCFCFPIFKMLMGRKGSKRVSSGINEKYGYAFILPLVAVTVLFGFFIPVSVVASAPLDFVNVVSYYNPILHIRSAFCIFAGVFLCWGTVTGLLIEKRNRKKYQALVTALFLGGSIDYFFFKADVGMLSKTLQFECLPQFERRSRYVNLLILLLVGCVCFFAWSKIRRWINSIVIALCVTMFVTGAFQLSKGVRIVQSYESQKHDEVEQRPEIRLSKNGKNVMVIMLDRAIGGLLPYCFSEKPQLFDEYTGFIYYPNTVSTGLYTNYGAPALFGGYDYTTSAMNQRTEMLLKDKHDEALKVMPVLFGNAGFQVDVADPPYAGYNEISDLSIYDPYPYVHAFYMESLFREASTPEEERRLTERNLVFYTAYRCSPAVLQRKVYDGGRYLSSGEGGFTAIESLIESYTALKSLSEFTNIEDDGDHFFMMDNNLPHHLYSVFQLPDYTLPHSIDNSGYEDMMADREWNGITLHLQSDQNGDESRWIAYQSNMAALLLLGDWFEYLKSQEVYDNTRIIIVADHGRAMEHFDYMLLGNGIDAEAVNSLLLVKDFNAEGMLETDQSFMTNADVPALAMSGVISNPVNPFTGHNIDMTGKQNGIDIFWGDAWNITDNNGYTFKPEDAPWYHVEKNPFEDENWTRIE